MRSNGELFTHFGSVVLRVTGSGNFRVATYGLKDTLISQLQDTALNVSTDYEPTRLLNVTRQRLSFEISVDEFGEYFELSRFITFQKATGTQRPSINVN